MNLIQFAEISLIVALVLLPTVVAALINGSEKSEAEPEFDYDYR
jgi:hypothetical protein